MPVGRAHAAQVVKPNQVGIPLPTIYMGKQGSVGGQAHDVGVAFQPCHKGSFGKGGQEIVGLTGRLVM